MAEFNINLDAIRKNGIFLMVPAYGGQCFAAFTRSMMQLSSLCTQYSIPFETFFIYNESLIPRARNYCVDEFLRRKFIRVDSEGNQTENYYQHGIFIDADIEFNAIDVLVMAHFQNENQEHHIITGAYPKKQISMSKIKKAVEKGLADEDPDNLFKYVGDYVFNAVDNKPIYIDRPGEIMEGGTGFMMFRRETLLHIKDSGVVPSYKPDHINTENFDGSREITAFFDTEIDPESKRYLSEDYYFCKKARESGLKVWLLPWLKLKHHGYFIFGGSLVDMAQAGLSATTEVNTSKKKRK